MTVAAIVLTVTAAVMFAVGIWRLGFMMHSAHNVLSYMEEDMWDPAFAEQQQVDSGKDWMTGTALVALAAAVVAIIA